ncbi:MAG: hypothetical protein ACRDHX_01005 [Chloroflexota bacterium]
MMSPPRHPSPRPSNLARLGEAYMAYKHYEGDWRINVIAIDQESLRHLVSAIEQ